MSDKTDDLSVAGPGSPISLKKVIETVLDPVDVDSDDITGKAGKYIKVLLDQSNSGFYTEDAPVQRIAFEDAKENALYYKNTHFNGKQLPWYLLRHLIFFYYHEHKDLVYPHDKASISGVEKLLQTDEGKKMYEEMLNKMKFLEYNNEWLHMVGMIICICGCLKLSKQHGAAARLYIEHPEAHMHPRQEQLFMSFLHDVHNEYNSEISDGTLQRITK